ncbi:uncharacterized protein J3R85_005116 [Psidium guajava]|nr:uncharacterized protein J3R85_005116 [Psidium guajava]
MFNFNANATKVDKNNCNTFSLDSTGEYYFVHTFANRNHCSQGGKLWVTISETSTSLTLRQPDPRQYQAQPRAPPYLRNHLGSDASYLCVTLLVLFITS